MTNDWSFVWTPQFLVGTIVAGLFLNIVGAYAIRLVDRARSRLPAYFRRAREAEAARVQQLVAAATSDNALYAALAAEAARLRLHQLLGFFIAFVAIAPPLLVLAVSPLSPGEGLTASRVAVVCVVMLLFTVSYFQYVAGLEHGRLAKRLDLALLAVQRNRLLPIMD